MSALRRPLLASLALWALAACGGEPPTAIPTQPEPMPEPEPEPEPVPDWTPPPVWGTDVLQDENPDPDVVEVHLTAAPMERTVAGVTFEVYAYNGTWPGPLLHAKVGDEVIVHFENRLPEPTTVHWHGLRIPDEMDGSPRIQEPVRPGETFTYRFTLPDAGTFWYHPHVRSNEQVEKGLYGGIVVRQDGLPTFESERVLVLDDILLDEEGLYPFLASHPEVMHGRSGNVLLANGRSEGVTVDVEQNDWELWRIVNSANARTMTLTFEGATFEVVGTDGGLLEEPFEVEELEVPVGQRYDVLVRYDRVGTAAMKSVVLARDDSGQIVELPIDVVTAEVGYTGKPYRVLEMPAAPAREARAADREVTIDLDGENRGGQIAWTMNGEAHPEEPLFTFSKGETVDITIVNHAGPEHPFHLHGQFFEVLSGAEPGVKDTVLVGGLETVRIRAYMDNPGRWMAHCHILEHAELGMMSEIVVEE